MSCGCGCCPKCGCQATCTCNHSMTWCDHTMSDFSYAVISAWRSYPRRTQSAVPAGTAQPKSVPMETLASVSSSRLPRAATIPAWMGLAPRKEGYISSRLACQSNATGDWHLHLSSGLLYHVTVSI
ncbi:uncharacterized protein [Physcomitrium patens]|uniref:uncharacterized protein isoform X1 n=1 Tax=Physcomitrium patens TaxID=3218 RepID=UPI000D150E2A|nr:uncharacterized protein LOC112294020 isoform X1 [Physcomitrium patens]|eukprot:XP_024399871.1 uncharacterized protein LOC112294020 isoform X1 [Physcomitrella patens]